MTRKFGKAEVCAHTFKYTVSTCRGIALLNGLDLIYTMLPGVLLRNLQQFRLIATPGDTEPDIGHLAVGHFRHHHLVINHTESLGYLCHGISQKLGHRLVQTASILKCHRFHHGSMTYMHVIYICLIVLVMYAKHIHIPYSLRHYDTLCLITPDEIILLL